VRMRVTSFIALSQHEIPPAKSRDDDTPHPGWKGSPTRRG
jgi:hypothetical protein